jgi:FtsP/CotA-like multicopper oxidase with cupredoxin domain
LNQALIRTPSSASALTALLALLCMLLSLLAIPSAEAATREYAFTVSKQMVSPAGKTERKIVIDGEFVGPTLEFTEGDEAVITVTNQLGEPTSVHWHGLLLPANMDGVPGFSGYEAIAPGKSFTYRFSIRQSGTYWYHSHSKGQEQDGLYGAIRIKPASETHPVDRDYVVLISDYHTDDSDTIMSNLKKSSEYYVYVRRTLGDFFSSARKDGLSKAWSNARMWGDMRMRPSDLADISNYTFLINGKNPDQNWTGLFNSGERVRLRFINASAMSFFDVRVPGLTMTVIAADGQPVEPVQVDEFRFGASETYDVIVEPSADRAYTIAAEPIDRSSFALATLAPREGMIGPKPEQRAFSLLTMSDMGADMDHGSMSGMDHGPMANMSHGDVAGMNHGSMNHGSADQASMSHDMSNMNHSDMADMDHSSMDHSSMGHDMSAMSQGDMDQSNMAGMDHSSMSMPAKTVAVAKPMQDHSSMNHGDMAGMNHAMPTKAVPKTANPTNSPAPDFVTGTPGSGWADAGTPEGDRALEYQDLRFAGTQSDVRAPEREIVVRLGGNMERYIWTLNGKKYEDSSAIELEYGERVRLTFINDTMMAHPMHLHGMFVQLENGQPMDKLPNKHSIIVAPGDTYSALLTADEPGEWAFHCHLLYHMMSGMKTKVVVATLDESKTPATNRELRQQPAESNAPASQATEEQAHAH